MLVSDTKPVRLSRVASLLILPLMFGCEDLAQPNPKPSAPAPSVVSTTVTPAPSPPAAKATPSATASDAKLNAKIKFDDGLGTLAFSIKPEDDGAKLVDASEREIARYNLKGDKLKIKDSNDHVLGYVTGSHGKYHLKDPEQKTILFELKLQENGDWKLEDGHQKLLYKIKKRDYGFEIEDSDKKSLAKVKSKDGKVSLRDALDKTRYASHSSTANPLLLVCLGLDPVGDLSMKAALMVRIAHDGTSDSSPKGDKKP